MSLDPNQEGLRLPENAFRELRPGETYQPVVPAQEHPPEVTVRSVVSGFFWSVMFSAAATYIALKLGQGIESAIPISILAVGFSVFAVKFLKSRASTLLENVNILAIGATSGIIAGGSVFVMPAVHILGLQTSFFQIFLVPLLGGILGVFFLAPFRRYFVRDLHGKLPFPEATATTEILMAGKRGGHSAIVLTYAAITAALFDFIGPAMHGWAENFSSASIGVLDTFTTRFKAVFSMNTAAAVLGLGYIMGIQYAAIIMAGSLVSFLVLVPLFAHLGQFIPGAISAGAAPLGTMGYEAIFANYVRPVGIGGIFAAGIISILKMSPVIGKASHQAFGEVMHLLKGGAKRTEDVRTDRAMPMSVNLLGIVAVSLAILLYFRFSVLAGEPRGTYLALVSTALTLVITFLFVAVSAWAVAMISVTPISGMTLTTLIVTAVALASLGLAGKSGMLQVLLVGGVVCTALSMAGSLVTQVQDRLLAGRHAPHHRGQQHRGQHRGLPGHHRRHPPHGQGLRLLAQHRSSASPAGAAAQCHGRRAEGRLRRRRRALVHVHHRRGHRGRSGDVRRLRAGLRHGHVSPHGAELPARAGGRRGLVREPFQL